MDAEIPPVQAPLRHERAGCETRVHRRDERHGGRDTPAIGRAGIERTVTQIFVHMPGAFSPTRRGHTEQVWAAVRQSCAGQPLLHEQLDLARDVRLEALGNESTEGTRGGGAQTEDPAVSGGKPLALDA